MTLATSRMDWTHLLETRRRSQRPEPVAAPRSAFQRDFDRIIYSPSFRRLADKTQMFPLPVDDHLHSRLTHSLEVSTVGRSLGTLVGMRLAERGTLPEGVEARDLGDCVAAACLAHDLGNPPFGHVGERAIQEYFAAHETAPWMRDLDVRQRRDLVQFEGNAQGFRLAAHVARPRSEHGLDLACATLGALTKYPCASDAVSADAGSSRRKHGVHAAEDDCFEAVARACGLPRIASLCAWRRHPLAFLTEAADDIAYSVIDLEDGLRLKLVGRAEFVALLAPLCEDAPLAARTPPADREEMFELAGRLRTAAVDRLVREVVAAFVVRHDALLEGTFDRSLVREIPSADALERVRRADQDLCYQSRDVLKMELSGAVAIEGVLEALVDAALGGTSLRSRHLARLLGPVLEGVNPYERLLRVTDHVSGMTDHYVVRLFRELSGIRLPGGRD